MAQKSGAIDAWQALVENHPNVDAIDVPSQKWIVIVEIKIRTLIESSALQKILTEHN